MPDITFTNSPRTEIDRLKMTAKVIEQGFFQKHGFIVLPEPSDEVETNTLVIYPREMKYEAVDLEKYLSEWKLIEQIFWQELDKYFPNIAHDHGEIEVRVTRYGTVSSGLITNSYQDDHVLYYLRNDSDLGHLAAMIVNKILYSERKGLGITWTKREALMDFIMTRPGMKKIFPKFHPMMSQLSRVSASVRRQSGAYLSELGFVSNTHEFEVEKMRLSKLEKKIMKLLVEHQGEMVGYDELADVVWGEGEFKTFWAINKLVERMRGKLDKLGIDGKRVESVRGQGYLLK